MSPEDRQDWMITSMVGAALAIIIGLVAFALPAAQLMALAVEQAQVDLALAQLELALAGGAP